MARPRNAGPGWPKCFPFPAAIEFKRCYSLLRTAVPSFKGARATRTELRPGTCTQGVSAPLQCVVVRVFPLSRQKEAAETQQLLDKEEQIVVAMRLVEDTEQILIAQEQLTAANKALTGHLQHALCSYDLLKMMVALGAKIITRGTSEVVPPVGTNIELLVLRLPLELTPVNLYRAFSCQMAPSANLQFRSGIMDMQPVRTKADGTQLTEGKHEVIHVQMTAELHEFLKTGHGWEM
eukprot:2686654-Rhodomonas_salina.1